MELVKLVAGKDAALVECVQKEIALTMAKGKLVRDCYNSVSQKLQASLEKRPCW